MYHFQSMKISTQESNAILIDQSLFNTWAKKEDFRGEGGNSHSFQRERRMGSQSLPKEFEVNCGLRNEYNLSNCRSSEQYLGWP